MGSRIAGVTPWGSFMHKILPVFVVLVLSAFSQALLAVDSDDPGANYQGPQSGTLECTGAPIPQNAEYVFRNMPPVKLRLEYNQKIWDGKLLPGQRQTQMLVLKNISSGPQKKCVVHWTVVP